MLMSGNIEKGHAECCHPGPSPKTLCRASSIASCTAQRTTWMFLWRLQIHAHAVWARQHHSWHVINGWHYCFLMAEAALAAVNPLTTTLARSAGKLFWSSEWAAVLCIGSCGPHMLLPFLLDAVQNLMDSLQRCSLLCSILKAAKPAKDECDRMRQAKVRSIICCKHSSHPDQASGSFAWYGNITFSDAVCLVQ